VEALSRPSRKRASHSPSRVWWDQLTFEPAQTFTDHVRCGKRVVIPLQFLGEPKSRVLLITTGMPQAGRRRAEVPFNPAQTSRRAHVPIGHDPYYYIEPYTIANPDPRTAVPILLHGMKPTFQRKSIQIATDISGEVFHQRTNTPDKYMRLDILKNLRAM
jgi:hypothetical protein